MVPSKEEGDFNYDTEDVWPMQICAQTQREKSILLLFIVFANFKFDLILSLFLKKLDTLDSQGHSTCMINITEE